MKLSRCAAFLLATVLVASTAASGADEPPQVPWSEDLSKLVAALVGPTPMEQDLHTLTDVFGGRPTGSQSNLDSVEWAFDRFEEAGVPVAKETFTVPARWLERTSSITVQGEGIRFSPRVAAMPFSIETSPAGLTAPLVPVGSGSEDEFAAVGEAARDAFVLVETELLEDIPGLFREYTEGAKIEARAFAAGVRGIIYQGSRSRDVLHRHNASLGTDNAHPLLVMERDGASRALRLLRAGHSLQATVVIDVDEGPAYESFNVIGEIRGRELPREVVVVGAHIDSWDLGTGALDNACNVAMIMDIARQMVRLGITPRRTIRFALFNGEEQGLLGSWGYTLTHADELDQHVMASSYDTGSGRIVGFYTGGRPEVKAAVDAALAPIAGLGPFTNVDAPVVGTDNFDFMLQGVANLMADQLSADYGPSYHARTDTFDRVDLVQLRLNAAIAAAVTLAFAELDVSWQRQTRAEIQELVDSTDLGEQMRTFHLLEAWNDGTRGRTD